MRVRGVAHLALAASVLVLSACNGDDDAGSTTVPPATTDGADGATTTEPSPPSTTDAGTTSTSPTTTPSTTQAPSPTTTAPPPTTSGTTTPTSTSDPDVDAAVQARLDVIERTEASWRAVRALFEDPFNDELATALDDFFVDSQLEGFQNILQEYRDGNFRSVPRDGQPERYEADPFSLAVSLDAGVATVQVCHVDTAIIVETAGNPDGTDRIALDEVETDVVELDLRLVDGVWKVASARAPETEISPCP